MCFFFVRAFFFFFSFPFFFFLLTVASRFFLVFFFHLLPIEPQVLYARKVFSQDDRTKGSMGVWCTAWLVNCDVIVVVVVVVALCMHHAPFTSFPSSFSRWLHWLVGLSVLSWHVMRFFSDIRRLDLWLVMLFFGRLMTAVWTLIYFYGGKVKTCYIWPWYLVIMI